MVSKTGVKIRHLWNRYWQEKTRVVIFFIITKQLSIVFFEIKLAQIGMGIGLLVKSFFQYWSMGTRDNGTCGSIHLPHEPSPKSSSSAPSHDVSWFLWACKRLVRMNP
jgi:hypothetical protein